MVKDEEAVITVALAWVEASCEEQGSRAAGWSRVFKGSRFRGMDPAALPRFRPRLAPHCTDFASCRGLLCGLGGAEGDDEIGGKGPRWLLQKASGPEDQLELARRLFEFTTACPERGHLGAMLLAKKNDDKIRREVVTLTQNKFERAVEELEQHAQCDRIPRGGALLSVAKFMISLVEADLLAGSIIRNNVVPQLKCLRSDDARLLLCTLRQGLLQKKERATGNVHETVKQTIDSLVEVLESELARAKSPWMKLELQKAIRDLRG